VALVHFTWDVSAPLRKGLRSSAHTADGFRASNVQHAVENRHADGGFSLLGRETRARKRGPISALYRPIAVAASVRLP
jgi:hypothetical protein